MQLKILSWNIWNDGDFGKISAFLKKFDADIIGLQEVMLYDPTRDIINYLKRLGYDYACAPVKKEKDGRTMCNAVFSKQKIVQTTTHILSEAPSRNAVQADIKIGEKVLHVFSTHLIHTDQQQWPIQDAQADALIKALPATPTIVMGDFNATPESSVIQKMRTVMVDTDPTDTPTLDTRLFDCVRCDRTTLTKTRLDYIFVSKDLKATSFNVWSSSGSDHLPISVYLEVEPPSTSPL